MCSLTLTQKKRFRNHTSRPHIGRSCNKSLTPGTHTSFFIQTEIVLLCQWPATRNGAACTLLMESESESEMSGQKQRGTRHYLRHYRSPNSPQFLRKSVAAVVLLLLFEVLFFVFCFFVFIMYLLICLLQFWFYFYLFST